MTVRPVLSACVALLCSLINMSCQVHSPPPTSSQSDHVHNTRRIVGYVTGRTEIWRIDATKLTHINYAFAQVSEGGEVVMTNPQSPALLGQLQALKSKNPNLKIIVSVGGWGADHFSDAAFSDESRARFSDSAVDLIKRYGLDGIDLDWEYPGQPGPGIKYRAEDKQNFTLLLKTLREHVDVLSDQRHRAGADRYLLTIASADREYFDHTEMEKLHVYLDFINIMAYDFYNSLTSTTGHHAGLYRAPGATADSRWGEKSVKQHLAAGIPSEKLVLGVAFYGRGFTGVDHDPPVNQPYAKYAGDYSFTDLVEKYIDKNGFEHRWDDVAKASYLWNAQSKTMISYDDERSLEEKAKFINLYNLGGVMYWEEGHDPDERLLSLLHTHLSRPLRQ